MQIIDIIKRKIFTFLHTERIITKKISSSVIYPFLPNKIALELLFYNVFGRRIDWKNPRTFNEKLQWLKLYNRNPLYTKLVDKYEVKKWVADRIGEKYIIPTLGLWNSFDEIDISRLPGQFVLKTTHGGGNTGVVICKDKNNFDVESARTKLTASLKTDTFIIGREWPYKNVPHRIIAEKYIDPVPGLNDLPDYKFFCFDGTVKALFIGTERQKEGEDVKFDFFDADFNHLPFRQGHDHAQVTPQKPKNFELMKELAEKLSTGILHVRVDFYDTGNAVFFGEMTFFHFGGSMPFEPEEWDYKFGEWMTLPLKNKNIY